MRVLFTAAPTPAHVHIQLPIAAVLREAGHAVAFATGPNVVPQLAQLGLPDGLSADETVMRSRLNGVALPPAAGGAPPQAGRSRFRPHARTVRWTRATLAIDTARMARGLAAADPG